MNSKQGLAASQCLPDILAGSLLLPRDTCLPSVVITGHLLLPFLKVSCLSKREAMQTWEPSPEALSLGIVVFLAWGGGLAAHCVHKYAWPLSCHSGELGRGDVTPGIARVLILGLHL